ncbi:MAG TPA: hypothetical protein VFP94_03760 [Terriglobales bacterium]|nr:hypothetical protein [Terriglobales bacterium]
MPLLRKCSAALLLLACSAWASNKATFIRPVQQTIPAAGITQVVVQNLVGPIEVRIGGGDAISLVALIHAGGHDDTFARALSRQLEFSVKNVNGQLQITGEYPLDHFRDYGYPHMKSVIGIHGTDSNEYMGQKVFVRDVDSQKAVELWAEIRLTVPARLGLVIRNIYGDITLNGGIPPAGQTAGRFDGFTDVGDFTVYRPEWSSMKIQSSYGKVSFTDGFGASRNIAVKTNVGSTYFTLPPGANPTFTAHKDLGFLHNDVSESSFKKDSDGNSVLQLGDGQGAKVNVEMSVGSLHLSKVGSGQ